MNGPVRGKRVEEFARLAELAVDRPGAEVATQLARDAQAARLVGIANGLRGVRLGGGPDPAFKAELRARLMSVAGTGQATATPPRPAPAATPRPVPSGATARASHRTAPQPSPYGEARRSGRSGPAGRPFIPAPRPF